MTRALPVFYSFRRCPYAMRARLALDVSETQVALREVVLRDKPAEMLEASHKATVPVLVLTDGTVIDESLDIMRWALAGNDPEAWLEAPENETDELIGLIDGPFKHHLDRYKYATRYEGAVAEEHREQAAAILRDLDTRLARTGWLCGERASLADFAMLPFVRQFANTDRDWFDAEPWPHLKAWLQPFLESARFKRVMPKFPQWKSGDDEPLFPAP